MFCNTAYSQDFSNKGREFWVLFPPHAPNGTNLAKLSLYITSDKNTSGNIIINGVSTPFNIIAFQPQEFILDRASTYVSGAESATDADPISLVKVVNNKGIRVLVDEGKPNIVVYAHMYASARSAATIVLPTSVLERRYQTIAYTQTNTVAAEAGEYRKSQFSVIAVEDGTKIKIQLRKNGTISGTSYEVSLPKAGTIYSFQDNNDITGTSIESISDNGSQCKKIAVFSGSSSTGIPANTGTGVDPLFQQCYPLNSWGLNYFVTPFKGKSKFIVRVLAKEDLTNVTINGQLFQINAGQYKEIPYVNSEPFFINSDKPICVAEFSYSQNQETIPGNLGDPDMVILNPIEQNISDVTVFLTAKNSIKEQYINVIIKNEGVASFKINGNQPSSNFIKIPNSDYSYLQEQFTVSANNYLSVRLTSDSGFNAFCYGFGNVESYMYSAGTNVKDLYQKLLVTNKFASVTTDAITCKGSPFIASITLPYKPISLKWLIPDYTIPDDFAPQAKDSVIINSKWVYTYQLDKALIYNNTGIYNFRVIVNNPTADGCSGEQEINFDLEVSGPPNVKDTIITNNCVSDSVQISDQTIFTATDRKVTHYLWDMGNGIFKDTIANFKFKYDSAGKYNVRYYVITDIGCFSDTASREVVVDSLPMVKFGVPKITCQNNELIFSDSTKARGISVLQNWFWDYGDGSKIDSLSTSSFMKHTYTKQIIYNPILSVQTANGCKNSYTIPIQNHANPIVGFILPEVCLEDAFAEFKDTTKIDDNINNFTYQWNFNAENPQVFPNPTLLTLKADTLKNPKVKYLKPGKYLVGLKVTQRDYGCIDSTTVKFTVNGSIPKPYFLVLKDTALCSNELVEIRDSSWVDIGDIGKLEINWGDGKKDTIETPKIDNVYKHYYANITAPNALNLNYTIKINASSGGVCVKDTSSLIKIVPPPEVPIVTTVKDYLCISDSLFLDTKINGGVAPFVKVWATENSNASVNGDYIYGINGGGAALASLVVTDEKKCIYPYKNILAPNNINVREIPSAQIAAIDTVICNGAPVTITGSGVGAVLYNWYRNDTLITKTPTGSISMNLPGTYKLTINDGKCNSVKTNPREISALNITKYNFYTRDIICIGVPLEVTTSAVDQYAVHYKWDFGDGFNYLKANPGGHKYIAKGEYSIKLDVTNDYCPRLSYQIIGKSVKVSAAVSPTNYKLFFIANQSSPLSSKIDPGYIVYKWDPITFLSSANISNPIFKGDKSTDYTLTRIDTVSQCSVTDEYEIIVSTQIFVNLPNAFTPNNDGLNDVLKPAYSAGVGTDYNLKIFNRWGKLLFQTNDINKGWDGKDLNGILQEMDSYSYFIQYDYIDPLTSQHVVMKQPGSVILFR